MDMIKLEWMILLRMQKRNHKGRREVDNNELLGTHIDHLF